MDPCCPPARVHGHTKRLTQGALLQRDVRGEGEEEALGVYHLTGEGDEGVEGGENAKVENAQPL